MSKRAVTTHMCPKSRDATCSDAKCEGGASCQAEFEAFKLGFYECLRDGSGMGRTWDHDQDLNEAYDRGMNLAEELFPDEV